MRHGGGCGGRLMVRSCGRGRTWTNGSWREPAWPSRHNRSRRRSAGAIPTPRLLPDDALVEVGVAGRRLRPFKAADGPALAHIFHAAVHGIASRYYTPEQVSAWSPALADASRWVVRAADGRATWVLADQADRPIAYADLERNGHIDHLYAIPITPPRAQRQSCCVRSRIRHVHGGSRDCSSRQANRHGASLPATASR